MDRKRIARLLMMAAALLVALFLAKSWPKEQTIHYVLGDGAARVAELDARWAAGSSDDWTRQTTFHYAPGTAPRIVTHEPRLPDGDYTVEIEIVAADSEHSTVRRHVTLSGGPTSIELGQVVPHARQGADHGAEVPR